MFNPVDPKQSLPEMEENILKFWEENQIFEKSLEARKNAPLYSFYDGPPFATGLPHYGHIVASTMKDVVPRYWTMRGYRVPRVWGWDCHGLPIENIAEKELGVARKKEILEKYGVQKFNEICRSKVLEYVAEWKKIIRRLGRWADMENSYRTMDLPFMESVWWVFKELWNRGLIYEGYRSMHICPRCETTLSQSEVAEGYKIVKDLSAIVKFELIDEPGTYLLAWTTTPWTLIGNMALAVGENIEYVLVKFESEYYIVAKDRAPEVFSGKDYEIVREISGKDLVGMKYKPVFDYYSSNESLKNRENGWKVYAGDFVTTEEGTGIVHIAPAFGEDDLKLGQKYDLPFVSHVDMDGTIRPEAKDFSGLDVKPIDDSQKTDVEIIKFLAKKNLLFAKAKYEHSYPHCWRCDTPLLNYATSSWFVNILKIKERMLELAGGINWSPEHIKVGRFGNWLEGARDWSISRQRFWASVIPIWRCEKCGETKVVGSVDELEKLSGEKISDLHKHVVDKITFKCEKCGGEMKRIPDVLDTWFDSGSMPYAQAHYPFENKEEFEKSFPADFIAEGVDQTRAWFYYLHAIATGIKDSKAYKNVIVNGIVVGSDGKKLSKRLKNYPDPAEMMKKYGADALRYYLMASPVVAAENFLFLEKDLAENVRGMLRMLWNTYSFFVLYANIDEFDPQTTNYKIQTKNLLDKWIISELNALIKNVNLHMEKYELNKAVRLFPEFVDHLSNWYVRRSRKRFWKSENDGDKNEAYETLHYVLVELAKLMAPFMPFVAEEIYRNLASIKTQDFAFLQSVHLENYPQADEELIDEDLNQKMRITRRFVKLGLAARAKVGIKVRQPLAELKINEDIGGEMAELVKDEVNVKKVHFAGGVSDEPGFVRQEEITWEVGLDTSITDDLRLEGEARELIRRIQELRKKAGFQVDNRIELYYKGGSEIFGRFSELIAKETLADQVIESAEEPAAEISELVALETTPVKVWLRRV
ncbi:MAG: isoleucine--tRNA ligase [Candidatus Moranbacteria bacterium]|nr:isoleucine--tRNA ligase [Candidatus Moranbacteria bacterium]